MQRDSDKKKKSATNGLCARGLWQARQGMTQVQREQADEVRKEAECRSLQSRVEAKKKQTHASGKETDSNQVCSKSTADSKGRDSNQGQRSFR